MGSCALSLGAVGLLAPAARAAGSEFVERAKSPAPLTNVTVDPATEIIYAQENEGKKFFSYDPRTNVWSELPEAPINSGNNGGATYLNGKIYTSYAQENGELGVYDIAAKSWSTTTNPLHPFATEEGTGDITTVGEEIYMAVENVFFKYNPATNVTTKLATPSISFTPWGGLHLYKGEIYGDAGNGETTFASYDIATNSWKTLPSLPGGAVLGSALDPVSGAYFAYGSYGGKTLYRYDIAKEEWTTVEVPFALLNDGGMAYVSLPGLSGVYMTEGEDGPGFSRYTTPEGEADLSLGMTAEITSTTSTGGEIRYTIEATNHGPLGAVETTLTDSLPAGASLLSADSTGGGCSGTSTVTCSLGYLEDEASATATIIVSTGTGTATNTAKVSSETLDGSTANNSASASTAIVATPTPPAAPAPAPAVQCVVPGMRGVALAKATAALTAAHCAVGTVRYDYSKKIAKGEVIYGDPHAGEVIAEGSKVDLWVSRGSTPARCVVPRKVHGMPLQAAEKALRAARCAPGKVITRYDGKVRKGSVIYVRPSHGRIRPVGTQVMIWVSRGPRHAKH